MCIRDSSQDTLPNEAHRTAPAEPREKTTANLDAATLGQGWGGGWGGWGNHAAGKVP